MSVTSCNITEDCKFITDAGIILGNCDLSKKECFCSINFGYVGETCDEISIQVIYNILTNLIFGIVGILLLIFSIYLGIKFLLIDSSSFPENTQKEFKKTRKRISGTVFLSIIYSLSYSIATIHFLKGSIDPTFVEHSTKLVDRGEPEVIVVIQNLELRIISFSIQLIASISMILLVSITFIDLAEKINSVIESVSNLNILRIFKRIFIFASLLLIFVFVPFLQFQNLQNLVARVIVVYNVLLLIFTSIMLHLFNKIFKEIKIKQAQKSLTLIQWVCKCHLTVILLSMFAITFLVFFDENEGTSGQLYIPFIVIDYSLFIVFVLLMYSDLTYCKQVLSNFQQL